MMKNGFYEVNGKKFVNKITAIYEAQQTNSQVTWNFHDDAFTKLNWSIEPEQSLKYFYMQRAIELRNKYDYLVLHYSGGNDSNQVMQSFIDAGVHIDEVVLRTIRQDHPNDITDLRCENVYAGYSVAYVNATYVKNTLWPALKISEYNITDISVKNGLEKNWLYSNVCSLGLINRWREYDINTGTNKLTEKGKTVAHILGIDKPMLNIDANGWHLRFLDKLVGLHITTRSQTDTGFNVEFFYWADSCGPMLIKQSHVLLKALAENRITKQEILGRDTPSQNAVGRVIYSNPFRLWAEDKPDMPGVIKNHEIWFYKDTSTAQFLNWKKTLTELSNTIDQRFLHGDILDDVVGHWSRQYTVKYNFL